MPHMLRLSLLWVATAVSQREDAPSLEIEAYFHSRSTGQSGVKGILVEYASSVPQLIYNNILLAEKYSQDFRYLAEFGIALVAIAPHGIELSLEPLSYDLPLVRTSVNNLQLALTSRGQMLDVNQLVSKVTRLSSPLAITYAAWKLDEISFFLNRFDEVNDRFAGPHDIDAGDPEGREYANQVRTREEEMDVVYKILAGNDRSKIQMVENIEFANVLKFIESGSLFADTTSIPPNTLYKLSMGYDKAIFVGAGTKILDSFCCAYDNDKTHAMFPQSMKDNFEHRIEVLQKEYRAMEASYNWYNFGFNALSVRDSHRKIYEADLLSQIRLTQDFRRGALTEYQYFKLPFKSVDGRILFSFYTADPEERGFRVGHGAGQAYPFNPGGKLEAISYISDILIPCFQEIDEAMYAGRLADVVVHIKSNSDYALALTRNDGRAIVIVDLGYPLMEVVRTVRHECGHVFSNKMHDVFEVELNDLMRASGRRVFSDESLRVLRLVSPFVGQDFNSFGYGNHDKDRRQVSMLVRQILNVYEGLDNAAWGKVDILTFLWLEHTVKSLSHEAVTELQKILRFFDIETLNRSGRRGDLLLIGDRNEFSDFSSVYASTSRLEESAELAQQLANNALRAGLYDATLDDAILRTKVDRFLEVFSVDEIQKHETPEDQTKRVTLVNKWKSELHIFRTLPRPGHADGPLTILILSDPNDRSLSSIREADKFAHGMILNSRRHVSLMHLTRFRLGNPAVVKVFLNHGERGRLPTDLICFGEPDDFDGRIKSDLQVALSVAGRNLHGQKGWSPPMDLERMPIHFGHAGCIKFMFGM